MTKVKVDVQLIVTGETGGGKSAITNRLLRAIQADHGLQSICKIHPTRCMESVGLEQTGLSFEGDLKPNADKKAIAKPDDIPGYPDATEMLKFICGVIGETELSEALKDPKPQVEYKPFKVVIDHTTGAMYDHRPGESLHKDDRVIKLLAAAEPTPVGEHQPEFDQAGNVGSGARPQASLSIVGGDEPSATGGYVDRCASVTIPPKAIDEHTLECNAHALKVKDGECICDYAKRFDQAFEQPTQALKDLMAGKPVEGSEVIEGAGHKPTHIELSKAEIQSGISRVRWAEGLIRQLPSNHEGRNSWLLNYGTMSEQEAKDFEDRMKSAESAAPKDNAHKYPLAFATLESLIQGFASQFKEHSRRYDSVLYGNFWVIFADGSMRPMTNYKFSGMHPLILNVHVPVYYAERD